MEIEIQVNYLIKNAKEKGFDIKLWLRKATGGMYNGQKNLKFLIEHRSFISSLFDDPSFLRALFGETNVLYEGKPLAVIQIIHSGIAAVELIEEKIEYLYKTYKDYKRDRNLRDIS